MIAALSILGYLAGALVMSRSWKISAKRRGWDRDDIAITTTLSFFFWPFFIPIFLVMKVVTHTSSVWEWWYEDPEDRKKRRLSS